MPLRHVMLSSIALCAWSFCAVPAASASTFNVLYSFCHGDKFVCADGKNPTAALISDKHGNLYGTTSAGGSTNSGVIFELKRGLNRYKYQVLHSFDCGETCAEGGVPVTPLIIDKEGNLYGTAVSGGSDFGGTAFELSPGADGATWTYKVIINFCSHITTDCIQGMVPESGLTYAGAASGQPYDGVSPLYGTTLIGGTSPGVVYQLTPNGGSWTGTTLYSFCQLATCADGSNPSGQIAVDGSGATLYGTTNSGGNEQSGGIAYRLNIASGALKVLHTFCSKSGCTDGQLPGSGITLEGEDTLFGAVPIGGLYGQGALYHLTGGKGKETLLYSFCQTSGCPDGQGPNYAPILAGAGLIGTAAGGNGNNGVLYQLDSSGAETVLHTFCQEENCSDGSLPLGVLADPAGTLFGVTQRGGKRDDGIIYQLTALP